MSTMWTEAEYLTLKQAVASGVLEVRFNGGGGGDRTVKYQSLDKMRALLAEMEAALYPASVSGRRAGVYIATSKGV